MDYWKSELLYEVEVYNPVSQRVCALPDLKSGDWNIPSDKIGLSLLHYLSVFDPKNCSTSSLMPKMTSLAP